MKKVKGLIKSVLPSVVVRLLRSRRNKDYRAFVSFVFDRGLGISLKKRINFLCRVTEITDAIESPHTETEILAYARTILSLPETTEGCIVECGCFKGSSTAKFSLCAKYAGRKLVVFDSFEGIPENHEPHEKNIFGGGARFSKGDYCGTLEEVKGNIQKFGDIQSCVFIKGWFDKTLPAFKEKVAAMYVDVDLVSSTKTCLRYLYPLLSKDGVLYSQDGHLPLVVDLFDDDSFWKAEVGCRKPQIEGLGKNKLIKVIKNGSMSEPVLSAPVALRG